MKRVLVCLPILVHCRTQILIIQNRIISIKASLLAQRHVGELGVRSLNLRKKHFSSSIAMAFTQEELEMRSKVSRCPTYDASGRVFKVLL